MSTLRVTNIQDLAGNDVFSLSGGNMTVAGNLTVQGTTTSIETTNLTIEDKNIVLGLTDPAATDATADGGGITLKGDTDKIIAWNNTSGSWHSNVGVNITSGNLGIGTISPSAPLEISNTSPRIRFNDTDGTNTYSEITATTGAIYLDSRNNTSNGQIILRGLGGGTASEYARLDASGRLLVGTPTALQTANTITPNLQISHTGSQASLSITRFAGASSAGPTISFTKTRSSTQGTFSAVLNNDDLGYIFFNGDDGAAYRSGAWIIGEADGDWASGDAPGRLVFSTTADGAASPTERMRIDSSGNVGIGTNSPANKLEVKGGGIAINNAGSDHGIYGAIFSDGNGFLNLAGYNVNLKTGTNNNRTTSVAVDQNGNVGIGIDNPVVKLHVRTADTAGGNLAMFDDSGSGNTGRLQFLTTGGDPTDEIRIAAVNRSLSLGSVATGHVYISGSNGNVGIGTISPGYKLEVQGAVVSSQSTGEEVKFNAVSGAGYIGTKSNHPLYIQSNNSNHITVLTNGSVGIGTDTPSSRLAVNGSITESTDGGTTYHNVVTAQDIGTAPNEVPLNQFLGQMAFMDEVGDIPTSSSAPQENYSVNFEYVSDTSIKIRMRGSDGVVRSATLTLS